MTRAWLPALVAMLAAACSGGASLPPVPPVPGSTAPPGAGPCRGAPPPIRYDHVVWIWMENHTSVLADPAARYERALASSCAAATDDADVGSPSLPNYLGATSGSTWGVGDDRNPSSHRLAVDNLFRQVRAAGGSERSYEEAMGTSCRLSGAGEYAVKHNPAAYYVGGADRAACQADDVPLGSWSAGALVSAIAGGLPTFAFVTPDLCDDTHDCSIAAGDAPLAAWVPRILAGADYGAGRTAVVISWDEPTPMAEVVVAPSVRPGTRIATRTDHYALLRTTEEMLGLPLLGAARGAPDLRPLAGL